MFFPYKSYFKSYNSEYISRYSYFFVCDFWVYIFLFRLRNKKLKKVIALFLSHNSDFSFPQNYKFIYIYAFSKLGSWWLRFGQCLCCCGVELISRYSDVCVCCSLGTWGESHWAETLLEPQHSSLSHLIRHTETRARTRAL